MTKFASITPLFLFFLSAEAQQNISDSSYTLSGTVVNGYNNQILTGANIVSNRRIGTKTNETGEFTIKVFSADTLKISYIGFKTLYYNVPIKENGKYLVKFKLYKDSVSLSEIEIFPWPTYEEFKDAFLSIHKEDEKIVLQGINTYQDRSLTPQAPTIFNPASLIYDKLFDKQAKLKRRIAKRREQIKESTQINE